MSTITYLILTVVFVAISSIIKSRSRQFSESELGKEVDEQTLAPEEELRRLIAEFERRAEDRSRKTGRIESAAIHPDSQEKIVADGSYKSGQHLKKGANAPKIEEKHPIIEDFDLKRAVVWSEILTPKFKEEEQ